MIDKVIMETKDIQDEMPEIIENFVNRLINNGYDEESAQDLGNDLYRVFDSDFKSAYGLVNSVISTLSGWTTKEQKLFYKEYFNHILTDVYMRQIKEDPKKMLYILNDYTLIHSQLYLSKLLKPFRNYARDLVLLNSTANQDEDFKYKPFFTEDDLKELETDALYLKDVDSLKKILKNPALETRLLSYVEKEREEMAKGGKNFTAKFLVLIYASFYGAELIKEEYITDYKKPAALAQFLNNFANPHKKLYHKDVKNYLPWLDFGRNSKKEFLYQKELNIHLKNIKKIIS